MSKELHMAAECMLFEELGPDEFEAALMKFAALVRADEREAMVAEAAKQGWAMKNEDPFEECVCEIAAIRARSGEQK